MDDAAIVGASIEDVEPAPLAAEAAAMAPVATIIMVVIIVVVSPGRGAVPPLGIAQPFLVIQRTRDQLLQLATIQPDTPALRTRIDGDSIAHAFVQYRGLTARALHGFFPFPIVSP